MGDRAGGIRGNGKPKKSKNPEINWRVEQTQIEYNKMNDTQKLDALNSLRKKYNDRKMAIKMFGNENDENVMLKATEIFFKRNKLKL